VSETQAVKPAKLERNRGAFLEMLISSLLGLVASLVLSVEAITLAADPNAVFSCDINERISCVKVALSWQANLLGFPNAFLGLIAEPVVITLAVAGLGGVIFPRWFLNLALGVYAIGLGFAYWLFVQAYFVIGALCPWCLLITVTTTTVFASLLRVTLSQNSFHLPAAAYERVRWALRIGVDIWVTVLVVAILAAMVIVRYL
jgi:uncharacterized membrane protein